MITADTDHVSFLTRGQAHYIWNAHSRHSTPSASILAEADAAKIEAELSATTTFSIDFFRMMVGNERLIRWLRHCCLGTPASASADMADHRIQQPTRFMGMVRYFYEQTVSHATSIKVGVFSRFSSATLSSAFAGTAAAHVPASIPRYAANAVDPAWRPRAALFLLLLSLT